jgi:hypothetical protein
LSLTNSASVYIGNSTNASGLGTGGTLTTLGGASFSQDVFVGGRLDVNAKNITNVASPINSLDAVNKAYVDAVISNLNNNTSGNASDSFYEQSFTLANNVLVPEDIPLFRFDDSIQAFVSYVYVESDYKTCAFYTLRGLNKGSEWFVSPTYIGSVTNVHFSIGPSGTIQYTNRNTTGKTTIRYRTTVELSSASNASQTNAQLPASFAFSNIIDLTFLNSNTDSNQIVIHVSSNRDNRHGLYFLNCVLKGNVWTMNTHAVGNVLGVRFRLLSINGIGQIQYMNTNASDDYMIRFKQVRVQKSQNMISLLPNTFVPQPVSLSEFNFGSGQSNFSLILFLEVPSLQQYAMYEIDGFYEDTKWRYNLRFVGDITGIDFSLDSNGVLQFINPASLVANIRYIKNIPVVFQALPVNKGGTGENYFSPYSILRGNGTDPIIGTNDLIYRDHQLLIANGSSVAIKDTTGVSFQTDGGVRIAKTCVIADVDITPSKGDLTAERGFYAMNDTVVPDDVIGYSFNSTTKSFTGVACVTITTVDDVFDALYELKGLRKRTGWILNSTFIGDNVGINFSITSLGQVQYTSQNISDWIETQMKFRAITTSM